MHYQRWKKYGDAELIKQQPRQGTKPRFPPPNIPRDYLVAWAAGFIDGEETIGILDKSGKNKGHYLRLHVAQIDIKPLEILQGLFGGALNRKSSVVMKPNRRLAHTWTVSTRQAYDAIKEILPFLIVTRKQADLAIEFQAKMPHQRTPLTKDELQRRQKIREAISNFNRGYNQQCEF